MHRKDYSSISRQNNIVFTRNEVNTSIELIDSIESGHDTASCGFVSGDAMKVSGIMLFDKDQHYSIFSEDHQSLQCGEMFLILDSVFILVIVKLAGPISDCSVILGNIGTHFIVICIRVYVK